MSISTDVKVQWVEGDTLVGTYATVAPLLNVREEDPNVILSRTSFPGGSARQLSVTQINASQSADSRIIVTGIGADGKPLTEEIIPPIAPDPPITTTYGKLYFKEITSISLNPECFSYLAYVTIAIGIQITAAAVISGGNSIRLKGYSTAAPIRNTNNFLEFHNGDFLPETLEFEVYIPPLNINYPITDRGLVFKNGLYLKYVVGSLTMMNVFYA